MFSIRNESSRLPCRRGIHGMFPLHLAALSGFSDCCRKLLSSGESDLPSAQEIFHLLKLYFLFPALVDFRVFFACRFRFGRWRAWRLRQNVFTRGRGRRVSPSQAVLWLDCVYCELLTEAFVCLFSSLMNSDWWKCKSRCLSDSCRNLDCLNLLLNTGADFNKKDRFGRWV